MMKLSTTTVLFIIIFIITQPRTGSYNITMLLTHAKSQRLCGAQEPTHLCPHTCLFLTRRLWEPNGKRWRINWVSNNQLKLKEQRGSGERKVSIGGWARDERAIWAEWDVSIIHFGTFLSLQPVEPDSLVCLGRMRPVVSDVFFSLRTNDHHYDNSYTTFKGKWEAKLTR